MRLFQARAHKLRTVSLLIFLFALSFLVRQPLFNKEFTTNWESLSATTLITNEAWYRTPAAIHKFNVLFSYARPEDKFINDLAGSYVMDDFGNYYYISMPHLGFITSYLFFLATHTAPSLVGLEVFALMVHFVTCCLMFALVRRLTRAWEGSLPASIAAMCVVLFTPQALFYFQNGVSGSMLVVPYSVGLLLCVSILTSPSEPARKPYGAWIGLASCLLLGCLTDWHAYFTAVATALSVLLFAFRKRVPWRISIPIAAICAACALIALGLIVWQDSRINGLEPFLHAIVGRAKERVGAEGLGPTSLAFYKAVARYYVGYAPFLLSIVLMGAVAFRSGGKKLLSKLLTTMALPLTIAVLAVFADHLVLSEHFVQHSFTTVVDSVPIALLMGMAVIAFLETEAANSRKSLAVYALVAGCILACTAVYYKVYLNRPHPFQAAASRILSAAGPSDVIFSTWGGAVDRPLLHYLQRNIMIVQGPEEASHYLFCHHFPNGTLVYMSEDAKVQKTDAVLPSTTNCAETSERASK